MKQERCDNMLNYDLLMSIINEDRIIGEIGSIMSTRHGSQFIELSQLIINILEKTKESTDVALRKQAYTELVKIHQSLKQFLKTSYKQEYSDLMKSLSIIYIVYFLSANESEGDVE